MHQSSCLDPDCDPTTTSPSSFLLSSLYHSYRSVPHAPPLFPLAWQVMRQQLLCAASELPLAPEEDRLFFGPLLSELSEELQQQGLLGRAPEHPHVDRALHYIGPQVGSRRR